MRKYVVRHDSRDCGRLLCQDPGCMFDEQFSKHKLVPDWIGDTHFIGGSGCAVCDFHVCTEKKMGLE